MRCTHSISSAGVTIRFSDKPAAEIRAMLKANDFRWSPSDQSWNRRGVTGAADFLAALDRKLNPGRPDGACWNCKAPGGFFRPDGPATPVYCAACWQAILDQRAAESATRRRRGRRHDDPLDLAYEDRCAEACGFSLFGPPE
jgi:hypothetical protein